MNTRVSADDAQARLGELLDSSARWRAAIIIERDGQPAAVLISPDQFEIYLELSKAAFFDAVHQIQEANRGESPEETERIVAEEIAAVRRERRERREQQERYEREQQAGRAV